MTKCWCINDSFFFFIQITVLFYQKFMWHSFMIWDAWKLKHPNPKSETDSYIIYIYTYRMHLDFMVTMRGWAILRHLYAAFLQHDVRHQQIFGIQQIYIYSICFWRRRFSTLFLFYSDANFIQQKLYSYNWYAHYKA